MVDGIHTFQPHRGQETYVSNHPSSFMHKDYRCEDRKNSASQAATLMALNGLDFHFQKTTIITEERNKKKKKEPFSQDKLLKIQFLSRGLKLSNSTPGC
jgi:hypothetical protein